LFSYFANILATAEDRQNFTEMFMLLDSDGNGTLTAEEFEEGMDRFEQIEDKAKLKELTKIVVKKGQSMEL
jgi:Ca2+-binding EF-hand superfamily protein